MAFGFRVQNTSGTVQVDELFNNLSVVSSGTITQNSTFTSFLGKPIFTVTYSGGTSPCIAVQSSAVRVVSGPHSFAAGTWTYRIMLLDSPAIFSIRWWIFDVPPSSNLPKMGLVVRKPNGEITFRSDYKYLRVADFRELSIANGVEAVTLPTGREYAVVCSGDNLSVIRFSSEFPFFMLRGLTFKTESNVIYKEYVNIAGFPAGGAPPKSIYMVVADVTNY